MGEELKNRGLVGEGNEFSWLGMVEEEMKKSDFNLYRFVEKYK